MAAALPAKLKTADIQRFAVRAAQLEKFRPIVSYWCEYYILHTVLNKNLHTTDEECQTYALTLMDKLEAYKAANATNDAIVDDVAAKAYMENFALETFARADDAQRANKVVKSTADTFMAAATFLDLLSIWGAVENEFTAKSKFAKFHAARILRAFKAGEDPNATNPVVEEAPAPPADDGLEAELRDLEQQQNGVGGSSYQPPTVESAVPSRPDSTMQGQATSPPPLQQQPPSHFSPSAPAQQNEHEISPIDAPDPGIDDIGAVRQNSIGGGYFPTLSNQPTDVTMADTAQPAPQSPPPSMNPQDFYNTNAPPPPSAPSAPSPSALGIGSPNRPNAPTPSQMTAQPPAQPYAQPSPAPQLPPPAPVMHTAPPPAQFAPPVGAYKTDDEATMAAQKHARWAISALNFEDVNTAVKELRLALQSLGAT